MKLTPKQRAVADKIRRSASADFVTLAKLAELSPRFDFRGANLRAVDFGAAQLRGFDFTGADLSDANFEKADVRGAIFTEANIVNAFWSRSRFGPFYRVQDPRVSDEQIRTGMISGSRGRSKLLSVVYAHVGTLPEKIGGIEFFTPISPAANSPPGRAAWRKSDFGVSIVAGLAAIPANITKRVDAVPESASHLVTIRKFTSEPSLLEVDAESSFGHSGRDLSLRLLLRFGEAEIPVGEDVLSLRVNNCIIQYEDKEVSLASEEIIVDDQAIKMSAVGEWSLPLTGRGVVELRLRVLIQEGSKEGFLRFAVLTRRSNLIFSGNPTRLERDLAVRLLKSSVGLYDNRGSADLLLATVTFSLEGI